LFFVIISYNLNIKEILMRLGVFISINKTNREVNMNMFKKFILLSLFVVCVSNVSATMIDEDDGKSSFSISSAVNIFESGSEGYYTIKSIDSGNLLSMSDRSKNHFNNHPLMLEASQEDIDASRTKFKITLLDSEEKNYAIQAVNGYTLMGSDYIMNDSDGAWRLVVSDSSIAASDSRAIFKMEAQDTPNYYTLRNVEYNTLMALTADQIGGSRVVELNPHPEMTGESLPRTLLSFHKIDE
jgi:hypothetical protein